MLFEEGRASDCKSLRKIETGDAGFRELAATCVCFANAQGGAIFIGIEDGQEAPPPNQKVTEAQLNKTIMRLRSLCFNVGIFAGPVETAHNGGQFFKVLVQPSLQSIATTSDGKAFMRVGDSCQPVRGEEFVHLASEKGAFQWELVTRNVPLSSIPDSNLRSFAKAIRDSGRVAAHVGQLSDVEIAEHYNLIQDGIATNLGVLWLGSMHQRSRLLYPITVQYIVYDEHENKVRKVDWHDFALNPKELIVDIERQAVELTYFDELPQGLFRKQVRHYDPRVVRELLVNAIAHKSFTISGDIFIKVYPDRIEITNPGGLPIGVTTDNILHKTSRRNPHLIRTLHDLGLMEGEGSGYNMIYEITSRDGKNFPVTRSSFDSMTVTQSANIIDPESLQLMDFIDQHYDLSPKEFIVLGTVSRSIKILATQLAKTLQLSEEDRLRSYTSVLLEKSILISRGVKKGTEYLINPKLITSSRINVKPTLKVIEMPTLKALIEETLRLTPRLTIGELHDKLGDVAREDVRRCLYSMVWEGRLGHTPDRKHRRYWLA